MKQEQAHSDKRQFRRQCERLGMVAKSGRQWKRFRKGLKKTVRQSSTAEFAEMDVTMQDLLESPPITSPQDDPTII